MELDVSLDNESISIPIDNPFQIDADSMAQRIEAFLAEKNEALNGIDVRGLIPKMVRGIAGCEGGCPANARSLVSQGYKNFALDYIEGGILSAKVVTGGGKTLQLKMFPEF